MIARLKCLFDRGLNEVKISLPEREFTIETALPLDEVLTRLQVLIQKRSALFPAFITDEISPFYGEFNGQSFHAYQLAYRDSFNPQINGLVIATPTGTKLAMKMSLPNGVGQILKFNNGLGIFFVLIFCLIGIFNSSIVAVLIPSTILISSRWIRQWGFEHFHQKSQAHYDRFLRILEAA